MTGCDLGCPALSTGEEFLVEASNVRQHLSYRLTNANIDRVEGVCELVIGDAQARCFDVYTIELCESVHKRRVASFADVLDERAD